MSLAPGFQAFGQRALAAVEAAKAAAISQSLFTAISFVVIAYLTHSYLVYASLRHFPGPKLSGWTRIPFILWHMGGQVHLKFHEISETYGTAALFFKV
jgi:hypothetical protein